METVESYKVAHKDRFPAYLRGQAKEAWTLLCFGVELWLLRDTGRLKHRGDSPLTLVSPGCLLV